MVYLCHCWWKYHPANVYYEIFVYLICGFLSLFHLGIENVSMLAIIILMAQKHISTMTNFHHSENGFRTEILSILTSRIQNYTGEKSNLCKNCDYVSPDRPTSPLDPPCQTDPPNQNPSGRVRKSDFFWAFLVITARPCRLICCPVGGLVGGCGCELYLARPLFTL